MAHDDDVENGPFRFGLNPGNLDDGVGMLERLGSIGETMRFDPAAYYSHLGQALSNSLPSLSGSPSSTTSAPSLAQSSDSTSFDKIHNPLMMLGAALEGFGAGYQGRPAFMTQALINNQQQLQSRREQMALHVQQMQQQRQQQAENNILSIWGNQHLSLSQKKKMSDEMGRQTGSALGTNLARMADEELLGKAQLYKQYLPEGKFDELMQVMRTPSADLTPVEQWLKFGEEKHKATAEAQFQSQRFAELSRQHAAGQLDPMSPEMDELIDLATARKKRDEQLRELNLKNQLSQKKLEAPDTPAPSELLGHDREAFTQQLFKGKYGPGIIYKNLQPQEQESVNQRVAEHQGSITAQRTGGAISGQLGAPLPDISQWRRLSQKGRIETPPQGITKAAAQQEGFVNISGYDKEMTQINAAPLALQIIDDLRTYARAMIKTGPGLFARGKQKLELTVAGFRQSGRPTEIIGADGVPLTLGEVAELYDSVAQANADLLARAGGGQVGVATDKDTLRSLRNLASTSDTVRVMEEKFRRFRSVFSTRYQKNVDTVFGEGSSERLPKSISEMSTDELFGVLGMEKTQ